MRDLTTLSILPEILDAGADSLKIEGRMKKPEYVAGVTAMYRKYLDRFWAWDAAGRPTPWVVDPGDIEMLHSLYIRKDLSTGYYTKRNGRDLVTMEKGGYLGASEELLAQIRNGYCLSYRAKKVTGEVKLIPGEAAELILRTEEGKKGHAVGGLVQQAKNRPLSKEDVAKQLLKTGDSPFALTEKDITFSMRGDIFLAVSELNALRRAALEDLLQEYTLFPGEEEKAEEQAQAAEMPSGAPLKKDVYAQVQTFEQYRGAIAGGITSVILDVVGDNAFWDRILSPEWDTLRASGVFHLIALPPVFRESARPYLQEILEGLREGRFDGALVRTVEEMMFLRENGYAGPILADASCYQWNRASKKVLSPLINGAVLPYELRIEEVADTFLKNKKEDDFFLLPLYGRAELMVSAGCVKMSAGCCDQKEAYWSLRDRRDMLFPVHCICGKERQLCTNVIYNAVPTSLHGSLQDENLLKADAYRLSFTTETEEETREVCAFFLAGLAGEGTDRMKLPAVLANDSLPSGETTFTTGHFRKGAI